MGTTLFVDFASRFDTLNAVAHQALTTKRLAVAHAFNDQTHPRLTPTINGQTASTTSVQLRTTTIVPGQYVFRLSRVAICTAGFRVLSRLPGILSSLGSGDGTALKALIKDIVQDMVLAMGAASSAIFFADEIKAALDAVLPKILTACGSAIVVEGMATATLSAALFGIGCHVAAFLYCTFMALAAKHGEDNVSAAHFIEAALQHLGPDNFVTIAAQSTTLWAVRSMAVSRCTMLAATVPSAVILYLTSDITRSITTHVLALKNARGGWFNYAKSLMWGDQPLMKWQGGQFDQYLEKITPELMCKISGRIVVDPVRSRRNGELYERHVIYRRLEIYRSDPMTGDICTKSDYLDAPDAKAFAQMLVGAHLGGYLVPDPLLEIVN